MGALVALQLAEAMTDFPIGRMTQLGTPNQGSEVADALNNHRLFKAVYGPAGQQLTTTARATDAFKASLCFRHHCRQPFDRPDFFLADSWTG